MMLQPKVRNLIAECEKEVVLAIVGGAEQGLRLVDELLVFLDQLRRGIQSFLAVRCDIEIVGRCGAGRQLNFAEMTACKHRRIDESRQGNSFELNITAVLLPNR